VLTELYVSAFIHDAKKTSHKVPTATRKNVYCLAQFSEGKLRLFVDPSVFVIFCFISLYMLFSGGTLSSDCSDL